MDVKRFQAWKDYFLFVNQNKHVLKKKMDNKRRKIPFMFEPNKSLDDIIGMQQLWNIIWHNSIIQVVCEGLDLIIDLHASFKPPSADKTHFTGKRIVSEGYDILFDRVDRALVEYFKNSNDPYLNSNLSNNTKNARHHSQGLDYRGNSVHEVLRVKRYCFCVCVCLLFVGFIAFC